MPWRDHSNAYAWGEKERKKGWLQNTRRVKYVKYSGCQVVQPNLSWVWVSNLLRVSASQPGIYFTNWTPFKGRCTSARLIQGNWSLLLSALTSFQRFAAFQLIKRSTHPFQYILDKTLFLIYVNIVFVSTSLHYSLLMRSSFYLPP
jgi:hypothetical protein